MFHSAALKLTLWYLAIIMTISIAFSFSLYHVSSDDLGRNVNRQIRYFNDLLAPDESQNFGTLRQHQLDEDLRHLRGSLILFNLFVLLGGGAASYWLARRTLQPIELALVAQSRFASDASHELRTPLAAIQTENEVALRNKSLTKPQAVQIIESNLEEVAKLRVLSEGLLRLASGNGQIDNPQPVAVKDIAEQALARYQKTAANNKIKLTSKLDESSVSGDKDSLVELLSIFIDNAIKYSPSGNKVEVSSRQRNKNVLVSIKDNGMGIKKAELPHIFERFYRSDSSRSKAGGSGYGLGLAIAKKIIEAHHGYIEVASTPGKGTVFTLHLPAA
jgi:two-component system sensor histidine kinase CiaH